MGELAATLAAPERVADEQGLVTADHVRETSGAGQGELVHVLVHDLDGHVGQIGNEVGVGGQGRADVIDGAVGPKLGHTVGDQEVVDGLVVAHWVPHFLGYTLPHCAKASSTIERIFVLPADHPVL